MWLAEVSHRTHAPWAVSSLYMWSARGGDKKDLIVRRLLAQSVKQVQALKVLGHVIWPKCQVTNVLPESPCFLTCDTIIKGELGSSW